MKNISTNFSSSNSGGSFFISELKEINLKEVKSFNNQADLKGTFAAIYEVGKITINE